MVIIAQGRTVATGPLETVLNDGNHGGVEVRTPDIAAHCAVLADGSWPSETWEPDGWWAPVGCTRAEDVDRTALREGILLTGLRDVQPDLEARFLDLTACRPTRPVLTK